MPKPKRPAHPSTSDSLATYIQERTRPAQWTDEQKLEYYTAFVMMSEPQGALAACGIVMADLYAAQQVPEQQEELQFLERFAFELLYATLAAVLEQRRIDEAKTKLLSRALLRTAKPRARSV